MAALTIVGTPAWAATSAASVVLPDGDWADVPATAVSPPGYTDRLIDGGALKPLALESDALTASGTGRPRSLAVEASGSFLSPNSDAAIPLAFRDRKTADVGVSVSGRYDAGNYGILGIDGTLRYGNFSSGLTFQSAGDGIAAGNDRVVGGSLTLRDEHLPLGGTWEMDSLAGVVPRSFLSLSRAQARFYLPTSSLLGASAVWRSDTIGAGRTTAEPRLSFNASVGEPGLSGGFRLPEFVGLGGIEADAGVQWRPRPGIVGGVQAIIARNTRDTIATVFDTGGVPRISGEGLYAAIGAGGTNWRVQVNALHSETRQSGAPLVQAISPGTIFDLTSIYGPGSANGLWTDAIFDRNRVSQSAGLFYLDPRLAWGASPMPADAYGGYYRIDYQHSAGRLFGSIDVSRSVSGEGLDTEYADAGIRQRLSAINNIAVGVEAALRIADAGRRVLTSSALSGSTTKQATIYGEATTGLGGSRAEGSYAFDASDDILQLSFTQTWHLPSGRLSGLRISTQVFYDRQHDRQLDGTASSSDGFGGAVSAGGHLFAGVDLDATIAYGGTSDGAAGANTANQLGVTPTSLLANVAVYSPFATQRGTTFSATASVYAQLAPQWSLTASFTDAESRMQLNSFEVDSGAVARALATQEHDRLVSGTLALRYSFAAGRPTIPIGMASPRGGWGRITGRVFMDSNRNGVDDANEAGAGGVHIILDGRFSTQTDAAGLYHFDDVATGPHTIVVQPDALPLPWHFAGTGGSSAELAGSFRANVTVDVRRTSELLIAVVR